MIHVDPTELHDEERYLLLRDAIIPRPIAWVSTVGCSGVPNLAPYSFFNVCSSTPPILGFSCGRRAQPDPQNGSIKDTLANIEATAEFVVNLVPETMAEAMIRTSDALPSGSSEFAHAGLYPEPSTRIAPPRVLGVPVAYECRLHSIIPLGESRWVMGEVLAIQIHPECYRGERREQRHRLDVLSNEPLRPYARLGGTFYARLRAIERHERRDESPPSTELKDEN